jgi:hypothetical protein
VYLTYEQPNLKTKSAYTDEKLARSKIYVKISSTNDDCKEYSYVLKKLSYGSRFNEPLGLVEILANNLSLNQ